MCWSILYHENKIKLNDNKIDHKIYNKVNVLENVNFNFQVDKIIIQNKLYYNITHNQCACDFFNNKKNMKLKEFFKKFIFDRMEIPCVEPYIRIKWIKNDEDFYKISSKEIKIISKNDLSKIFTDEYSEVYYKINRNE